MPNIKSAKDRVLLTEKQNLRNRVVKSNLKTTLKKADAALAAGENKEEVVRTTTSAIDKACKKGVLHKKAAARKKSQLAKKAAL